MLRHNFSVLLLLVVVGCLLAACTREVPKTDGRVRPNIIYILADDLGYGDLSCYGQTKFITPNIDRLGKEGMRFTQHYAGSTVCAPSRSALLTGLHTGHTYVRGNKEVMPEGQHPLADSIVTLAEFLQTQGYVTGAFGKWGLGYPGSEGAPLQQGFDVFYGYNCQRFGHHYYPYHLWSNGDSISLPANAGAGRGSYAPDLIHRQTLSFLEANADTSFFLYVPSIIPHAELDAPDSLLAQQQGKFPPEKSYSGAQAQDEGFRTNGRYAAQATPHAAFVAMVQLLDQQVGEIVQLVHELGIADKTLIIFSSDNGPHQEGGADPDYFNSNGPYRGYKRDLYEGGIRVPMIASWPGTIPSGQESDHVSASWDIFSTVSDLLEQPTPVTDGISFLPTLTGQGTQPQHDFLYWEFHERGGRQAIRRGHWKAVRYQVNQSPPGAIELYDLSTDAAEENDLASDHPTIVKEMEELFRTARTPSPVFRFASETFAGD
ncbi:MAG: arylsulfatase [Bacteroidota bacterium]